MPKYLIKGKGEETLNQNNWLAKGGEGSVYWKGDTAYKIYEDPSKMIPSGKMAELAVLTDPRIIRPDNVILDPKTQERVGYTMKYVQNTTPLVQIFSRAYQQREQITPDMLLNLVRELYEIVAFVHSKDILIVDCNEMNFIVSKAGAKKYRQVFGIDVNSYQTKSYPAPAIMESIRDRHCKNHQWSVGTDWFSWSVLATRLILGIHPYDGKHPKFDSVPMAERQDARMKANVSIFHADATVPAVVPPFTAIPDGLRQYLVAVFEKGVREVPPKDFSAGKPVAAKVKQVHGSNLFVIDIIKEFGEEVVSVYTSEANRVVITKDKLSINNRDYGLPCPTSVVGFTPKMNRPVLAYVANGHLKLYSGIDQKEIPVSLATEGVMEYAGRLYAACGTGMFEVQFAEIGGGITASMRHVGNVLDVPGASQVFDGCLIQNLLGKWFVSVFPQAGRCQQVKLDELDPYSKVIEAKYENGVLVVVGVKKSGKYDRVVYRFNGDLSKFDVRKVEDVTLTGLNFTVTDAGVCALLNEDEKLEVFSNKIGGGVQIFDDPAVTSDMKLFHEGAKITFAQGRRLFSITMKKKP
jgi:hypothetical protein